MYVEIAIFLTLALIFGYVVANYVALPKNTYQGAKEFYGLNEENTVLTRQDLPWSEKPCALRFVIFVGQSPRTISKVDCLQPSATTQTSFKPSCKDSTVEKCACSGITCTRCSADSLSMNKLVWKGDAFEFLTSGYTGQNDKSNIPAILKIKTVKDKTNHYMEAVMLPALPLQKWTVITIVKEGRRFDVYYGANLVTSKLLDYVPIPHLGGDWVAGNKNWGGKIGLFKGFVGSITTSDVAQDVESIVDTTGRPKSLDALKLDMDFKFDSCMFGNCNKIQEQIPINPYLTFKSSLA